MGTATERDIERFGARRVVGAFAVAPLTGFSLGFVSVWVLFWPVAVFPESPWAFLWPVLAAFLIVVTVFVALRKLLPARFRDLLPMLVGLFVFAGFLGFLAFVWVCRYFRGFRSVGSRVLRGMLAFGALLLAPGRFGIVAPLLVGVPHHG